MAYRIVRFPFFFFSLIAVHSTQRTFKISSISSLFHMQKISLSALWTLLNKLLLHNFYVFSKTVCKTGKNYWKLYHLKVIWPQKFRWKRRSRGWGKEAAPKSKPSVYNAVIGRPLSSTRAGAHMLYRCPCRRNTR